MSTIAEFEAERIKLPCTESGVMNEGSLAICALIFMWAFGSIMQTVGEMIIKMRLKFPS
jgi:hypothetical protein